MRPRLTVENRATARVRRVATALVSPDVVASVIRRIEDRVTTLDLRNEAGPWVVGFPNACDRVD